MTRALDAARDTPTVFRPASPRDVRRRPPAGHRPGDGRRRRRAVRWSHRGGGGRVAPLVRRAGRPDAVLRCGARRLGHRPGRPSGRLGLQLHRVDRGVPGAVRRRSRARPREHPVQGRRGGGHPAAQPGPCAGDRHRLPGHRLRGHAPGHRYGAPGPRDGRGGPWSGPRGHGERGTSSSPGPRRTDGPRWTAGPPPSARTTRRDILFTSGTTGAPKGVVQTHGRTLRVAADWVAMTGLAADDRYLMVNPYFHMFGLKAGHPGRGGGRGHDDPRGRIRRGRGPGDRGRRRGDRPAGRTDPVPVACSTTPSGCATTCRACGWPSPGPPTSRSS